MQANLTGQQTGALSAGYGQALKGALDEAQLMNAAAKTQADIAKQEQDLGIAGAGALTKAGAERQKYEQSLLDAPLAIAKEASGLMRGLALPVDQTKTFTGPKTKDYYQMSDAQRLGGVMTFLGSAAAGKGMDVFKNAGSTLLKYLKGEQDDIDLGGGLKMKFDQATGAPYIQGGSGYLATDDPMSQIYKDAGFMQDETGTYYLPNIGNLDETGTRYMIGDGYDNSYGG
jgi:hypothetical protein